MEYGPTLSVLRVGGGRPIYREKHYVIHEWHLIWKLDTALCMKLNRPFYMMWKMIQVQTLAQKWQWTEKNWLSDITYYYKLTSCKVVFTSWKMAVIWFGERPETWTITKSLLSRLDAFEMWVYRSFKNIVDGKHYQRRSIEKDGNRQRNSETIQDEETTISRTSNKA